MPISSAFLAPAILADATVESTRNASLPMFEYHSMYLIIDSSVSETICTQTLLPVMSDISSCCLMSFSAPSLLKMPFALSSLFAKMGSLL